MINLALAIIASAALSVLLKFSEMKTDNTCGVALFNYLTCSVIAFIFIGGMGFAGVEVRTVLIGGIGGFVYLATILLLLINIKKSGAIMATVFNRLGVLIPVLLSFTIFGENPTLFQLTGILLAVVAIVVINYKKDKSQSIQIVGLLVLLVAGGLCDSMTKFFDFFGNSGDSDRFIFFIFAFAALFCIVPLIKSGKKITWTVALFGFLVGLPNYFITRFLLASLAEMPAFIVYPSYSVGTVVLTSIFSRIFFKERINKQQFIGIGIILVSLVLLNM